MEPLTEIEKSIVAKLATATFPPATASKRFAVDLASGRIQQLSERGRAFLAFVANRFRRQYKLTEEEWDWVKKHWKKVDDEKTQGSEPVCKDEQGSQNSLFEKTTGEP